jgi:hypothetical protein
MPLRLARKPGRQILTRLEVDREDGHAGTPIPDLLLRPDARHLREVVEGGGIETKNLVVALRDAPRRETIHGRSRLEEPAHRFRRHPAIVQIALPVIAGPDCAPHGTDHRVDLRRRLHPDRDAGAKAPPQNDGELRIVNAKRMDEGRLRLGPLGLHDFHDRAGGLGGSAALVEGLHSEEPSRCGIYHHGYPGLKRLGPLDAERARAPARDPFAGHNAWRLRRSRWLSHRSHIHDHVARDLTLDARSNSLLQS